jgi:exopolysaccharide biosynthesis protein
VTIELGRPSLAVHVSREANRGKPLSAIARAEGAVLAINGSFFRPDNSLCGVAVARGATWTAIDDANCIHGLSWPPWALTSTQGTASKGPILGRELISGYPTLLRAATPQPNPPAAPAPIREPNPRTMLGVDASRTHAFLVVVDGRDPGHAAGLTLEASMELMRSLGAYDAINPDGGGSTELWIENEGGVQNTPSDGHERPLANAVVVTFDASREIANGDKPRRDATFEEPAQRRAGRYSAPAFAVMAIVLVVGFVIAKKVSERED